MRRLLDHPLVRGLAALALAAPLGGCGIGGALFGKDTAQKLGEPEAQVTKFGVAVADEPDVAAIGRRVLSEGGNAADAAVAMGFAMAVALPSRASLGGGGACVIHTPKQTTALVFPAGAPASLAPASVAPASLAGDRPAGVPMLARGLLAIEARYGHFDFPAVITPAERLAAATPVSPALAADLAVVGPALLADPAAAAVFGNAAEGAIIHQPDLAIALATLRTQGVLGFYQGSYAQEFAEAADAAGGGLTAADLARARVDFTAPAPLKDHGRSVAFLPADGGQAEADYRALAAGQAPAAPSGAALPASAGFAALDDAGDAVACATSLNNLFGTGRVAPGTGIVLAAAPRQGAEALLSAGIAYDGDGVRAVATGTGQGAAPLAAAAALYDALHGMRQPLAAVVPDPGRANLISCRGGQDSCKAMADPRGHGLALR